MKGYIDKRRDEMKILKIFTVIGVFFIFMVSTTWAGCSGTTQSECTNQTWTQNSCIGNKFCDEETSAQVTKNECNIVSRISQNHGRSACTWSTREVQCTWADSCCTTGGSC